MGPLYILRQEGHILRHPERHTEGFDEVGGDGAAQLVGRLYILTGGAHPEHAWRDTHPETNGYTH